AARDAAIATPGCGVATSIYGVEMRALAAEMAAHPRPDLSPIPIDEKMLYQRAYRRVIKETDVYDGPGGAVVGHIDSGFTFVNAGQEKDGWIQIRPNQWLPKDTLRSEEHTSELQSRQYLVCRLLLEQT